MLWVKYTLLLVFHISVCFASNDILERKSVDSIPCQVCMATINEVFAVYYKNRSAEALRNITVDLCTTLKIETAEVCKGIVNVYLEEAVQLAELADNSTVRRLCGLYNDLCLFDDEWTVDVDLGTKPAIIQNTKVSANEDKLAIVHVTDMHYDPAYLEGGNADCGEPTCCRAEQGNASRRSSAAGHWGDYRHCDTPLDSVHNTLQQIKQQVSKIDFVYMTGDFVDHGVWQASREINTNSITKVVGAVKKTFPNIPIIFTLGNHEPVPVNQYSPLTINSNVSSRWLYELVAELWAPYISKEAQETILSGGFYTMKLREGFRVIVLNNVVGYGMNFWMALNSTDPYGQLKWLAETLLQAEKDQEKVHILYHIQMQSCLKTWGREFHRIVDRFENIITGQFNGHTHTDEFQVFYSLGNTTRANSVLFNGGSGTANANVNPNYRVYTVDPATWYVYDAETWVFNLTEANLHPHENPKWYQLYSFREAFGVESLTPWELESLVNRMCDDHQLVHKYSRYFVKGADTSVAGDCGDDCLKEKLCTIVTTHKEENYHCSRVKQMFEAAPTTTPQPTTASMSAKPSTTQTSTEQSTIPGTAFSLVPSKILLCIVLLCVFNYQH